MPNSKPIVIVADAATFIKNEDPVRLSPRVSIAGDPQTMLDLAIVAITVGFHPGDCLALTDAGGTNISARYDAATGVLALSGTDTLAHYQEALQNVVYFRREDGADDCVVPSTRRISWAVVDDAGAMSANRTTGLAIGLQGDPLAIDPNPGVAEGETDSRPQPDAVRRQWLPWELSRRAGGARQPARPLSPDRPSRAPRTLVAAGTSSYLAA